MHAVLLGVTKSLLQLWFDPKYKQNSFYITKVKKAALNIRLSKIKPCTFISRRPRSVKEIKLFKASEFRNLLLYYFPVCLNGIQRKKYIDHFNLLSSSIFILLKERIQKSELEIARRNLCKFVEDFQTFYSVEKMTMNVHLIQHLCDCVDDFGPLWSYSMFAFENHNGKMKDFVVANKDVLMQITTRYIIDHSMIQTVTEPKNEELLHGKKIQLTNEERNSIRNFQFENEDEFYIFKVYQERYQRFTSKYYTRAKKTIDYFVKTVDDRIGKIVFYFKNKNINYALLEEYSNIENVNQIQKVKATGEYFIIKPTILKTKLIYMKICSDEFVVERPNTIERD